jgi:pilus assembly protein FimV
VNNVGKLSIACLASWVFSWASINSSYALGLGHLSLDSHLNQPLQAKIQLNGLDNLALSDLKVKLAEQQHFEQAGLEFAPLLLDLNFAIATTEHTPVVKITTNGPVTEPYLSFIVEANWPDGQLFKEYSLLLDPPDWRSKAQPAPDPKSINKPLKPKQLAFGSDYGPTESGDRLWEIAANLTYPHSDQVYPAMLAIVQKNPKAFIRNNINGLKLGQSLQLPTKAEVAALTAKAAWHEVQAQNTAWTDKTTKSSKITSQPTPLTEPVEKEPSPTSAPASNSDHDPVVKQLEILGINSLDTPEETELTGQHSAEHLANQKEQGTAIGELTQRLALIEETLDTLNRTNKKLKSRQQQLQIQNQDLQERLKLRELQLKALQTELDTKSVIDSSNLDLEDASEPMVTDKPGEKALNSTPLAHKAKQLPQLSLITETLNPAVLFDSPVIHSGISKELLTDLATEPTSEHAGVKVTQEQEQEQDLWFWLLIGLFISGLGAGAIKYRQLLAKLWSRQHSPGALNETGVFEIETITQPQVANSKEALNEALSVFETEQSSDTTHYSQDLLEDDNNEDIQFVAVELYITYKRYEHAQAVLQDILLHTPKNWAAHTKLLEVYSLSQQWQAFNEHFQSLPPTMAKDAPEAWKTVEQLLAKAPAKRNELNKDLSEKTQPQKTPDRRQVTTSTPEAPEQADDEVEQGDEQADQANQQLSTKAKDKSTVSDTDRDHEIPSIPNLMSMNTNQQSQDSSDSKYTLEIEDTPTSQNSSDSKYSLETEDTPTSQNSSDSKYSLETEDTPTPPTSKVSTPTPHEEADNTEIELIGYEEPVASDEDIALSATDDLTLPNETDPVEVNEPDISNEKVNHQEMESALAIAQAYLDINDTESALEQLSIVLRDGSPEQRSKAEKLKQSID